MAGYTVSFRESGTVSKWRAESLEGSRCTEAPTRPAIAEIAKGATDEHVRERALSEKRVLITRIGTLANWCTRGRSSAGVILVRFIASRIRSCHCSRSEMSDQPTCTARLPGKSPSVTIRQIQVEKLLPGRPELESRSLRSSDPSGRQRPRRRPRKTAPYFFARRGLSLKTEPAD